MILGCNPHVESLSPSGSASSTRDPALDELRDAYLSGNLVLFVGSGISAAAGMPSWRRLVEQLAERIQNIGGSPAVLEEIKELVSRNQFIDALSAAKAAMGGPEFCAVVEKHLNDKNFAVPEIGRAIATLAPRLRAIITTNLDHLLERALAGTLPVFSRPTTDIAQRRGFLLKLHGTLLERDTWVLTRDEYDRAMYAEPKWKDAFSAVFHTCPILFVGYALADDDFDQILARVRAFAGQQPPRHFALATAEDVTPFRQQKLSNAGIRIIAHTKGHGGALSILHALAAAAGFAPPRVLTSNASIAEAVSYSNTRSRTTSKYITSITFFAAGATAIGFGPRFANVKNLNVIVALIGEVCVTGTAFAAAWWIARSTYAQRLDGSVWHGFRVVLCVIAGIAAVLMMIEVTKILDADMGRVTRTRLEALDEWFVRGHDGVISAILVAAFLVWFTEWIVRRTKSQEV